MDRVPPPESIVWYETTHDRKREEMSLFHLSILSSPFYTEITFSNYYIWLSKFFEEESSNGKLTTIFEYTGAGRTNKQTWWQTWSFKGNSGHAYSTNSHVQGHLLHFPEDSHHKARHEETASAISTSLYLHCVCEALQGRGTSRYWKWSKEGFSVFSYN